MLERVGISIEETLLILFGVVSFLLILILILFIQNKKLSKKYKTFMSGCNGISLEQQFINKLDEINTVQDKMKDLEDALRNLEEKMVFSIQKVAVVKYDAFKEMGGNLSFVLVLLDDRNCGYLINSMHSSREGCYMYVKEIRDGESEILLSEEEEEALIKAKNNIIK